MVTVDPLASMRCWAIEVELGGRAYEVPALPAADWWQVLAEADPAKVIDLIPSADLDEMLLTGELSVAELIPALTEAVEEAAGRSLHAAVVLATVARMQWPVVNGRMARGGFRWDVQPLGAALDAIHAIVLDSMDKEGQDKFLAILDNEALSSGKPSTQQRGQAVDDFEAMAGPRPTTGVKSTGEPSGNARPKTRIRSQQRPQGGRSAAPRRRPGPRGGSAPAASS